MYQSTASWLPEESTKLKFSQDFDPNKEEEALILDALDLEMIPVGISDDVNWFKLRYILPCSRCIFVLEIGKFAKAS